MTTTKGKLNMVTSNYEKLPKHYKGLVAVGVLLDGIDSEIYLQNDFDFGEEMAIVAQEFGSMLPEMRVPLLGTLLRQLRTP